MSSSHRTPTAALALAVLVIALTTSRAWSGTDWVIRPIVVGPNVANADVMVRAPGNPIVGYGVYGGPVVLASVRGASLESETITTPWPCYSASFAQDGFGNVYFAATSFPSFAPPELVFGQAGTWTAGPTVIDSGPFYGPVVGLDRNGVPAVAGANDPFSAFFTRFDVPSGQWQGETAGPSYPRCGYVYMQFRSFCFTSDDRPTIADFGGPAPALRITQRGEAGWSSTVVSSNAWSWGGVSVATAPPGGVGYVFNRLDDGLVFGMTGGPGPVEETISPMIGTLSPHSLAYDSNGNPAVVATQSGKGSYLFRRDPNGTWSQEVLPVEGYQAASLTFDGEGNPYVVAFSGAPPFAPVGRGPAVTLLSPALPPGVPGDFDANNVVNAADIDLLLAGCGTNNLLYDLDGNGTVDFGDTQVLVRNILDTEMGDINLDGNVDLDDLTILGTFYGVEGEHGWAQGDLDGKGASADVDLDDLTIFGTYYGSQRSHTTGGSPVPDPPSLLLAMAGALALVRRRRRTHSVASIPTQPAYRRPSSIMAR